MKNKPSYISQVFFKMGDGAWFSSYCDPWGYWGKYCVLQKDLTGYIHYSIKHMEEWKVSYPEIYKLYQDNKDKIEQVLLLSD